MKIQRLFVLLMIMGFQVAFANPTDSQQAAEQAVFGTPPVGQPYSSSSVAPPVVSVQRLKPQDLRRYIKSAQDGNINAANLIKEAANGGDKDAALQYGYLAHIGKLPAVGTNYPIAMKAYKKAARQKDAQGNEVGYLGNHLAAYNIGVMYLQGQGVPQSNNEAYRWFKIANEAYQEKRSNHVFFPAAVQMARALQSGVGVARDDKAAVKMWRAAADERCPDAMTGYAKMVMVGRGTIQNPTVAYSYLNSAANKWNLEAIELLANHTARGNMLNMEPNLSESAKWYIILAGVNKKKFAGKARVALSKLDEKEQKRVRQRAYAWLSNHSTMPEPFDYTVPLNDETRN